MADPDQAYVRTWAEVNDLKNALTPSEFGRVCQCLLAIGFKETGYKVTHFQFVGRPDFVIERLNDGYSVEAKAPTVNKVMIKPEDIRGVEGLGHRAVVAVLTYPELATRWLVIEAVKLRPGIYSKIDLTNLSNKVIEREVSNAFGKILVKYKETALVSASKLRDAVFPTDK